MPKPRHDNPFAERMIVEHGLRSWESAAEQLQRAREAERVERRRAELAAVDWESLSPAELFFRWMLSRPRGYEHLYGLWAHETLEAWKARQKGGGHSQL